MPISRRSFAASLLAAASPRLAVSAAARELPADVVIAGGGTGGCAAALAALRNGLRVILTEETDWVGGQLTSQLVPPDEHRWIETHGATRLYREYRGAVRDYYRRYYPLTAEARSNPRLNPGGGSVSGLTHEPRVSLAVLQGMLAPHISGGRLTLLLEHKPVAADIERDRVRGITVRDLRTGRDLTLRAPWFLDATETGGLLPLTRTEYVTGFESRSETGEAHAPAAAQPANVQAFTVCFAMDYDRGADHTIERPEEYVFWRDYVPKLTPPWTGKLLSWTGTHPVTLQPRTLPFDPTQDTAQPGQPLNLWLYRRIARAKHFEPETFLSDISLVNWPQNDYWLGRIDDVPEAEAARHVRRAKQLSLSLLYWMQTDGGWKGLRLRRDVAGTADGLAKAPYVRESRRIRAEFTVLEQHVTAPGQRFSDPVGVGSYRIDLHPSTGGDNYIDIASQPFQIPLGSLIPRRVDNLIPACKNIGVTHITNGCYRLHPVEWNIGESAGMLAAFAQSQRTTPRAIRATPDLLESFQALLTAQGIQLSW